MEHREVTSAGAESHAIRGILCAVVALIVPCAVASDVMTLDQAIAIALDNNRGVKDAALEVDKSRDALAALRTHRYPSLDFRGGPRYNLTTQGFEFDEGVFGDLPLVGPIPPTNTTIESQSGVTSLFSVSVSQPLSQQYRLGLRVDKHETDEDLAEARLAQRRDEVSKRVKDQYLEILQRQSDLEAIKESIAYYDELYGLVRRYVEEQVALPYEELEVKAHLERKRHDEAVTENALKTDKERMNDLLGRDVDTDFAVMTLPEVAPAALDPEQAQQQALSQRPDVREARLRVQSSELDHRIQKAGYIPDIDLRLDWSKLYGSTFIPDAVATVGVLLRWDIYDWGRKKHQLAQDDATVAQASNSLQQTEANVSIQVRAAIRDLEDAVGMIDVADTRKAAAREKVRVRMNQYRQQTILLDDVLLALSENEDALNGYNRAVSDVWKAQAALEHALGSE